MIEIIWTAWKLDEEQEEIRGRRFVFEFKGRKHQCVFGAASDRLLEIAKHAVPLGLSSSDFRNLRSFSSYTNDSDRDREDSPYGKPASFWIDNFDWDDDYAIELATHINFYLKYYDKKSPTIEINPAEDLPEPPRNRYFEDFGFPSALNCNGLNANLLILYSASFGNQVLSNFLNMYRIIEYVSYYFMHDEQSKAVKSILRRPHALHNVDKSVTDILFAVRDFKMQREQDAFQRTLKHVLHPTTIWTEISHHLDVFSKPTEFEGGLRLESLVGANTTADTFGPSGIDALSTSLTKIRNALAHGKDTNTGLTILPTARNFSTLKPWLHLITVAAGEVVLYDKTH